MTLIPTLFSSYPRMQVITPFPLYIATCWSFWFIVKLVLLTYCDIRNRLGFKLHRHLLSLIWVAACHYRLTVGPDLRPVENYCSTQCLYSTLESFLILTSWSTWERNCMKTKVLTLLYTHAVSRGHRTFLHSGCVHTAGLNAQFQFFFEWLFT